MIQASTIPNTKFFAREQGLVQLLMAFIGSGLFFMVFPGTLMGVWNLFTISGGHSSSSVSAAWLQAHGHAQLFGWIGSFILGIGFYSIPNLRRMSSFSFWEGWLCLLLWDSGVMMRWFNNVYQWNWEILLPLSAGLELAAVAIFFIRTVQGHHSQIGSPQSYEPWALSVISGTVGLALALCFNLIETVQLSIGGTGVTVPPEPNFRFLALATWGFAVPVAIGFIAKWMPVLLGLRSMRPGLFVFGLLMNWTGVVSGLIGLSVMSAMSLVCGSFLIGLALRFFEPSEQPAKVIGVHQSFPFFVRLSYIWLLVAAMLAVGAAIDAGADGIAGAGRHALTVGFLATLVFCVGPRMLPAFVGRKKLFSTRLMFASLLILSVGCLLRVSSEVLAYQGYASWAWYALPVSATLELTAILVFAANIAGTFMQPPILCQPSH
jgi:uncharacterized protein involved in response to NO